MKKRRRKGLRRNIILVMFVFMIFTCINTAWICYVGVGSVYMAEYYNKAMTTVQLLAMMVDGDAIDTYVETGETDEAYDELKARFDATKTGVETIDYLYLVRPYDDHFVYVLEAEAEWDGEGTIASLGDVYEYDENDYEDMVPDLQNKTANSSGDFIYGPDRGMGETAIVYAPVLDSEGNVTGLVEADYILEDIYISIWVIVIIVVLLFAAIQAVLLIVMAFLIDKQVVHPILALNAYVSSFEEGHVFGKELHLKKHNEIQDLADAFVDMIGKIRAYIDDIQKVTAEKERIGAELNVATRIQADMLPCIFPAFPNRTEFDIYASMTPAKEVGGDFYDFFLVDENHIALVIADVSGKGVPAALFMVIAKTLLKNGLQQGYSPAAVLAKVNNQLCENNEEGMFVTCWAAVYDCTTGILTAANAGHEFPAIRRADGAFELYQDSHGFVLAGMEDMCYKEYQISLGAGDTIFVYTDGVPEATNAQEELMGLDRMIDALNRQDVSDLSGMLAGMKQEIDSFAGEEPQYDDITMLAFRVNEHGNATGGIRVLSTLDNLDPVQEYITELLDSQGVPENVQLQLQLVVEEIFVNIVNYAYPLEKGDAEVLCKVEENPEGGKTIEITFRDSGVPFNPIKKEDADVTLSAEERPIGGLGIYMVKQMTSRMDYQYVNGKNNFTVWKDL